MPAESFGIEGAVVESVGELCPTEKKATDLNSGEIERILGYMHATEGRIKEIKNRITGEQEKVMEYGIGRMLPQRGAFHAEQVRYDGNGQGTREIKTVLSDDSHLGCVFTAKISDAYIPHETTKPDYSEDYWNRGVANPLSHKRQQIMRDNS